MQAYNEVLLEGVPTGTPERSHENHGQVFYRQFIEVPRLSGTADLLPMLLRQEQLAGVHSGEPLRIDGQLRSFNNRTVTGRRLILTVYGKTLLPPTGEAVNQIILSGTLCKPPVYRRTPLGRSICDLLLAVPRIMGVRIICRSSRGARPPCRSVPLMSARCFLLKGANPEPHLPKGHGYRDRGTDRL